MTSIPIMCLICDKSIKDTQFVTHMNSVHGGLSQTEGLQAERNIPPQQAPIVLDKETPPSKEFMEVAQMLDKPKEPPVVTSPGREEKKVAEIPQKQQEVKKPKEIKLEYKYSGECKDCLVPVETLVVKVKGQTVAVAFCYNHGQLAEREVADLEINIINTSSGKAIENILAQTIIQPRKEVKRAKRSKPKFFNKTSVQSPVSATGLQRS